VRWAWIFTGLVLAGCAKGAEHPQKGASSRATTRVEAPPSDAYIATNRAVFRITAEGTPRVMYDDFEVRDLELEQDGKVYFISDAKVARIEGGGVQEVAPSPSSEFRSLIVEAPKSLWAIGSNSFSHYDGGSAPRRAPSSKGSH
jgi:hypothetical protein